MSLPIVGSVLQCPRCSGTQVTLRQMRSTPSRVDASCVCGHQFPHPNQSFARDVLRGCERIDLDRSRS